MNEIIRKTIHHTMGNNGTYIHFVANVSINSTTEECFNVMNTLIDVQATTTKLANQPEHASSIIAFINEN